MLRLIAAIMFMGGILGLIVGIIFVAVGIVWKSCRKAFVNLGVAILLMSGASSGFGYYEDFISIQNIHGGSLIGQSLSPTGAYTLKIYLVEGGVTVEDPAILGELQYNQIEKKSNNIYWYYGQSSANVVWLNNETVSINGHVLNVLHDKYKNP